MMRAALLRRSLAVLVTFGSLALGGAASEASGGDDFVARRLAGLSAKPDVDCIRNYPARAVGAQGSHILFEVSSRFYYLNDAGPGCENIARGDTLVTTSITGRLCAGDIGNTVAQTSGTLSGSCKLGRFTEYRR